MKRTRQGGYAGRILRVDLSTSTFFVEETSRYLPEWIGGRGIAAAIAWREILPGMTAFEPRTPLILMTGPLTGTMAPFSGRTTVCGLAPQGYPREWYTRSSFGGHFGPELKYAGFDGIVITGRADHPVYLKIADGVFSLEDARPLWGRGIIDTQQALLGQLSDSWRVFAIGPAGENLVRIAVAATETESASGQGGFGAVMGSKNLKAVAVRGTGAISVADPKRFEKVCTWIREEAHGSHGWPHTPRLDPKLVREYGQRFQACTQGCPIRCYDARYYSRVPSKLCPGKVLSGQVDCIAGLFPGVPGTFYDWDLGFEAGFEISQLANDEGLNHWELLVGLVPWLRYMKQDGNLTEMSGITIDFSDIRCWSDLIRNISRRQGDLGDILAEGTCRAVDRLGIGKERLDTLFPAWGYAGHWDGHGDHINKIFYPYWIVSALQWAMDTRDPISSGHGYVQNIMGWCREHSPVHGLDWETICRLGTRVYGSENSVHPESGYAAKAFPAYWHGQRSVAKDSLPVDDQVFPRIFSRYTPDHFAQIGDMEGPQFEYEMFKALTGVSWTETEYDFYLERILQQERLLLTRNFDRSRSDDERIIPYFEKPENRINPFIGEPMSLDRRAFKAVMDEFYTLRGWDTVTGHVLPETRGNFSLLDD
jgi:aldehyde:ferredoxin oxidoreductase